jgi:hypothetical protein
MKYFGSLSVLSVIAASLETRSGRVSVTARRNGISASQLLRGGAGWLGKADLSRRMRPRSLHRDYPRRIFGGQFAVVAGTCRRRGGRGNYIKGPEIDARPCAIGDASSFVSARHLYWMQIQPTSDLHIP